MSACSRAVSVIFGVATGSNRIIFTSVFAFAAGVSLAKGIEVLHRSAVCSWEGAAACVRN